MDLKVLFHNPDELTNEELRELRLSIRQRRMMFFSTPVIFGLGAFLLDTAILRRTYCYKRIALGASLGFLVAFYAQDNVQSVVPRTFDPEIINAFEKRYLTTALNATGFGSNYVSAKDYSDTTTFKKPY